MFDLTDNYFLYKHLAIIFMLICVTFPFNMNYPFQVETECDIFHKALEDEHMSDAICSTHMSVKQVAR